MLVEVGQSAANQRAVLVDKRNMVGHGAKRRQSKPLEKDPLPWLAHLFRTAGANRQRPGKLESDHGAADHGKRVTRTRQGGMNQGLGLWQARTRLMMVGDDEPQAKFTGPRARLERRDAAIHCDDEVPALAVMMVDRCGREAITLAPAMGYVEIGPGSHLPEREDENGCARESVDIVIAMDADAFLVGNRLLDGDAGGLDPR